MDVGDKSGGPEGPDQSIEAHLAAQMESIILARLATDRLVLPALPAAALKCVRLLKDPELSLKAAAAVIEQDPVLTASLIRQGNSAAFATREPVKSVLAAVTKIGTARLKTFLFEASANQLFESRDERIARSCRALWEHSVAVGILAKDVVAFANAGDPDDAYLGGLLHDVGKPIVAGLLLQAERTATSQQIGRSKICTPASGGICRSFYRPRAPEYLHPATASTRAETAPRQRRNERQPRNRQTVLAQSPQGPSCC